ncbi:hypothetical protein BHE90_003794 [Fusarium euwallaceae]|uniref:Uncharacterized protein n=1 Tax=Fusarium euwallaceae TaxID=1147111 RepID=A0A430M150_9HYPO|nr:hypothetical protein BHE90_003794 [Fusarium euwallaceae]
MCQLHSLTTNITSTMADDCLGHLGLFPQCGICDDVILRHERVIALIGNRSVMITPYSSSYVESVFRISPPNFRMASYVFTSPPAYAHFQYGTRRTPPTCPPV